MDEIHVFQTTMPGACRIANPYDKVEATSSRLNKRQDGASTIFSDRLPGSIHTEQRMDKVERLLGAHMSIAGGVSKSIDRGLAIGCNVIQIFTGYNNRWVSQSISQEEVSAFHQKADKIKVIWAHNNYLINLASPNPAMLAKSHQAMRDELYRAEQLGLPYLVIHPGSHLGAGEDEGIRRIARHLNKLLAETRSSKVMILLETTAGQGYSVGYRFEQLAGILEAIEYPDRIGICFDTCHSFTAGYDLRTPDEYYQTFHTFDRIIGLSRIRAFHLNDSKTGLGSRRDRHEHIGQGFLGLEAFRLLLNDPRFFHIPMVIETPKGQGLEEDMKNLQILKSL